ncbi:hypothetical protein ABIE67_003081 [Streptomyces sp. V4I8]
MTDNRIELADAVRAVRDQLIITAAGSAVGVTVRGWVAQAGVGGGGDGR